MEADDVIQNIFRVCLGCAELFLCCAFGIAYAVRGLATNPGCCPAGPTPRSYIAAARGACVKKHWFGVEKKLLQTSWWCLGCPFNVQRIRCIAL